MNKRIFLTVLLIAAALLVGINPAAQAQDKPFRVAVVAPSATNDLAFSQSMYDALMLLQEKMGKDKFTFDFQEGTFVVDDAAVALRNWASSGEYNLVIAHGSQYGAVIQELAPEFPDVSFAWGTDNKTFGLKNVFAYTAASDQGGYINGAVAATLSKKGNIGVVGPIEVGDAKLYVDGFKVGTAATNPDVKVNVTYIQSFSDVPLATEAANTFVANGADILTGSAQMVVGPIAVAQKEGLLWFGTQSSQAKLAAKAGVLFQVYRWDVVLTDIMDKISKGTLGGEAYVIELKNGGLEMQLSAENDTLTKEQRDMIEKMVADLTEKISKGEIKTLPEMEATPEATPSK
jgi:basic membrane protein A